MSFDNFKYMYQEIVKILFVESNVVESNEFCLKITFEK